MRITIIDIGYLRQYFPYQLDQALLNLQNSRSSWKDMPEDELEGFAMWGCEKCLVIPAIRTIPRDIPVDRTHVRIAYAGHIICYIGVRKPGSSLKGYYSGVVVHLPDPVVEELAKKVEKKHREWTEWEALPFEEREKRIFGR